MRNLFFFLGLAILFVACQEEDNFTPSGTKYEIITRTGGQTPQPGEYVYFHAQIRNGDSVLYSSRSMGQTPFLQISVNPPAGKNVSPVEEVLAMMAKGDSATLFIRLDTVPADQKPMGFKDAAVMYYDIVSVDIKSEAAYQEELTAQREEAAARREIVQARYPEVAAMAADIAKKYTAGNLKNELQSTESGVKFIIHEEGAGKQAEPGKSVSVQYYGMLTNGEVFDNSFQRGDAFSFRLGVGEVIPGWDEGIALLKEGSKATLFIPSQLGYGEQGSGPIPPNAELIFYVELESVN